MRKTKKEQFKREVVGGRGMNSDRSAVRLSINIDMKILFVLTVIFTHIPFVRKDQTTGEVSIMTDQLFVQILP